jgi:hypothetical protein
MGRTRWFQAGWEQSLRAIATKMRSRAFTPEAFDGFLVDRARDEFIQARYIEKRSYKEAITDPFGEEQTFDRVVYHQVHFTLFREFPQIQLQSPPRSTQSFTSRLLEISNFSIGISALQVDPIQWADSIRRKIDGRVLMDTVCVSNVEVGPSIFAAMIVKGESDVRESLKAAVGGRSYTVDKVRLLWTAPTGAIAVTLSSNGSAKLDGGDRDTVTVLREALPR